MSISKLFFLASLLMSILMMFSFGCTDDDDDDDDDNVDDDDSICDGCLIGGVCYQDGEANPQNICLFCDSANANNAWSANDGYDCDDGLYCNGQDVCQAGVCEHVAVPDCSDDGQWCNGAEVCDEQSDDCIHTGAPCVDDTLFCNGVESCDEVNDICLHTGNPCSSPAVWCNEQDDECRAVECEAVGEGSLDVCATTLEDNNGVPQDSGGLTLWCELSEALFPADFDLASPFWSCWAGCVFTQDCDDDCFAVCQNPPDPGTGCGAIVHPIYACGLTFDFEEEPNFYIPEMDALALCADWNKDWECYQDCLDVFPCSTPPTPLQQYNLHNCLDGCEPSPAVGFDGEQWGLVEYAPELDVDVFSIELWFRLDENTTGGQRYVLASRLDDSAEAESGWELAITPSLAYNNQDVLSFFVIRQESVWAVVEGYTWLQPGDWYQVTAQFDGETMALYLFDELEGFASVDTSVVNNTVGLGIGARPVGQSNRFIGAIDEVRLSAAMLSSHFVPYEFDAEEDTVGLWHMNEKNGTVIADVSENHLHGDIADDSLWTWRISKNDWYKIRAHDQSAQTAGNNGRIAEELYYQNNMFYADNLTDLLVWDRNLTDDPAVTFQFGYCSESGYTFRTRHDQGSRWYFFWE
ncbi:MAG TPA: LamG domain-containing protein [bacterium]|nr:LamG domain-containing protein [bacterium]